MKGRRMPRWPELRPLLRPRPVELNRTDRRLAKAATVADLRRIARRRTPRAVFDYTEGAAEQEISLLRSREAFARVEFLPSVLRDVSSVDTSATILGRRTEMPLVFAPIGFTRMMNHEGELAVARVAHQVGIPYALSMMGTTSLEALAAAAQQARRWFQLSLWHDRSANRDLVARAQAAHYEALVLTVDTPVAGQRLRDVHNGLTVPPALTLRTVADAAVHPAWWFNLLTTEPLEFASLLRWNGTVSAHPTVPIDDVHRLREAWPGSLVVKGVQTVRDAEAIVDAGVNAVVVSNHGGRQLDRTPAPLEQLAAVVAAVGDRAEVYVDGGITNGADVVAAVALGARACLVGRAYLYGLMAGGQRGVQRVADILGQDMRRTMQLLGVTSVAELTPDRVRLRAERDGSGRGWSRA
jgi:L-lactate dehydrogenase (cytochrome)